MNIKESYFMESNPSPSSSLPKIIGIIVAILVCCSCIAIAVAGTFFYRAYQNTSFIPSLGSTVTPPPTVEVERPPVEEVSTETVDLLSQTVVPDSDPYALACRLQHICDVPTTVPSKAYQLGDQETFWASNVDTVENFQVKATLRYVTPHLYFWIENGASYNQDDVKRLGDTFENQIYPTDREFFGTEWTPGVDNDPHVYILYVRGTGESNAGYFSTPDEYNPKVKKYSNGHEMFVFNADNVDLSSEEAYSTLAHEFQHMIHWYTDQNETSW
ncbi:MAG TPA: hypothetical protein VJQ25_13255, partial [Nitrospira sp.]|nr:hypothetical protein [Nitrospira sp.]